MRFRVFVRRRGSRVPGRGAASAARQDKNIAGLGVFEGRRIPPQRSLSRWTISQTPRARKDAHTCRWSWTEKRAVSFHGEEINASCLNCPCARGKLPKPTSMVGPQAGRTPLSLPPQKCISATPVRQRSTSTSNPVRQAPMRSPHGETPVRLSQKTCVCMTIQ